MVETVLKSRDRRNRWAVALRMTPFAFGWAIMRAGEAGLPVSTFIIRKMEELARQDLQPSTGEAHDQRSGQ